MKLPTYLKDESGFCYVATEHLLKVKGLTPYDGEIDEHGFATEKAAEKPAKAAKSAAKPDAE